MDTQKILQIGDVVTVKFCGKITKIEEDSYSKKIAYSIISRDTTDKIDGIANVQRDFLYE